MRACVCLGQMTSAVLNDSSAPVNGTSVLRLHSLATDMAVIGRHVVGDVSAEVEAEPDVGVQLQWTTSVGDGPRYAVPIVGQYTVSAKRGSLLLTLTNVRPYMYVRYVRYFFR